MLAEIQCFNVSAFAGTATDPPEAYVKARLLDDALLKTLETPEVVVPQLMAFDETWKTLGVTYNTATKRLTKTYKSTMMVNVYHSLTKGIAIYR